MATHNQQSKNGRARELFTRAKSDRLRRREEELRKGKGKQITDATELETTKPERKS